MNDDWLEAMATALTHLLEKYEFGVGWAHSEGAMEDDELAKCRQYEREAEVIVAKYLAWKNGDPVPAARVVPAEVTAECARCGAQLRYDGSDSLFLGVMDENTAITCGECGTKNVLPAHLFKHEDD